MDGGRSAFTGRKVAERAGGPRRTRAHRARPFRSRISEVFVIGDTASLDHDGKPLPGVAQVSIQQGQ